MMKVLILICLGCLVSTSGQNKQYDTLKLDIPKNKLEPKKVTFEKAEILLDEKKCFDYALLHDHEIDGKLYKNYYEIKSLDNHLLFSGNIFKNDDGLFEDTITFYDLGKSQYKNSKIVGRNNLILNLSSNQVLNKDCSLNLENLKLFFDLSNENKNTK